jgi:hypothetical protein
MINRLVLLLLLIVFIDNFNKLDKYSLESKFNLYRSLMCLYFSFYALEIVLNNINISRLLTYTNNEIIDITEWFKSYLILDLIYMVWNKSLRWDLFLHHVWCLINYLIATYYNNLGYFHVLVLINECISIVSGIDSIAMEDKQLNLSKKFKKYRIYVINYIRRPIWLLAIIILFYYKNNINIFVFYHGFITCIFMLFLDFFWYKKCIKAINK